MLTFTLLDKAANATWGGLFRSTSLDYFLNSSGPYEKSGLDAIVVLFDEMDELLRERAAAPEAVSRFLTTSMLPKFQALHDQRKLLFFVATNFSKLLDAAIGRPGRFDMAIHVAPPTTEHKITAIDAFAAVSILKSPARENLVTLMRSKQTHLDYFNFGEFEALLQRVLGHRSAQEVFGTLDEELRTDFGAAVDDMYKNKILLREGVPYRTDFETDLKKSALQ